MLTKLFNELLLKDKLPEDFILSSLVPFHEEKCDSQLSMYYSDIELLDHKFKLYESLTKYCLVYICMRTVDSDFHNVNWWRSIIPYLQTQLFYLFVDMEKAFDGVPWKKTWGYKKGVPSPINGVLFDLLLVQVGVYQESVLSIFLFATVMDVLTEDVMDDSLMEMLYNEKSCIMVVPRGELYVEGCLKRLWKEVGESTWRIKTESEF